MIWVWFKRTFFVRTVWNPTSLWGRFETNQRSLWRRFYFELWAICELWVSRVLWSWWWAFSIVVYSFSSIMLCGYGNELQLWQQGASTIAATSIVRSFINDHASYNVELRIRFLYLNFFPLTPNQMILISRLWGGEDVFFNALNRDLTLWEAFVLSC
jgi:hypothetical protein